MADLLFKNETGNVQVIFMQTAQDDAIIHCSILCVYAIMHVRVLSLCSILFHATSATWTHFD